MWNEPSADDLSQLPSLYATDGVAPEEKIIHMHFFLGGSDWYCVEYGSPDRVFFGYAILNGAFHNAEWGYVSLDELKGVRTRHGVEVELDLHWRSRPASEVERIADAEGRPRKR